MRVRIGSRASKLALWQAEAVKAALLQREPDLQVEIVEIVTQGDRIVDRPLAAIGGKGLFVKEIETALSDGAIDIAAHSAKDLPGQMPPDLVLGAVLPRAFPEDALVARGGFRLDQLPQGAVVGTSSLRRRAMLLASRPDLQVVSLRGNLDTRLHKVRTGFDAITAAVLARAGLVRMGWQAEISEVLPIDTFMPAAGQGTVAIQVRRDDQPILSRLAAIDHLPTRYALEAERAFLATLGGSCHLPLGAYVTLADDRPGHPLLMARAQILTPDGRTRLAASGQGDATQAERIGRTLAEDLLAAGGAAILAELDLPTHAAPHRPEAATDTARRPHTLDPIPVIITRAATGDDTWEAAVSARGLLPVNFPVIAIEELPDIDLAQHLAQDTYDWLLLTSRHGARLALRDRPALGATRIAAVGAVSAGAVRDLGYPVAVVASQQNGAGLAQALLAQGLQPGQRCLYAGARASRGDAQKALRALDVKVDEIYLYATTPRPEGVAALTHFAARSQRPGFVVLASPSALDAIWTHPPARALLRTWSIACIGSTTADRARALSLPVAAVAAEPNIEALLDAMQGSPTPSKG